MLGQNKKGFVRKCLFSSFLSCLFKDCRDSEFSGQMVCSLDKWAVTWQNQQNECALSKDSDQPGHRPCLIRVFAIRMKKSWVLIYSLSVQRRPIRLGGCPGWSESSQCARAILLVLSCDVSNACSFQPRLIPYLSTMCTTLDCHMQPYIRHRFFLTTKLCFCSTVICLNIRTTKKFILITLKLNYMALP